MESFNIEKAYDLVIGKLQGWLEAFISMLPNLAVALLVMLLFFIAGRLIKKVVSRLVDRISTNKALNRLVGTVVFFCVLCIGIFTALSVLKLEKAVTSLLAGAGIIGLALGFAFQDSAANFISGIFMATRKPFQIGDLIKTADTLGIVQGMNLRNTILLSFQGQYIYIPNKDVYQQKLVNYTTYGKRRIDIDVEVSYGDDLEKAARVVVEAINKLSFVIDKDQTSLIFKEFGDSSINGTLMYWIKPEEKPGYFVALTTGVQTVKAAFDENDITIPFPIRTLDFGIKGGEKLSAMISQNGFDTGKKEERPDRRESPREN